MTPTPEDQRRAAEDGPEDDMRQDVHIDRLYVPTSTKWAVGILLGGIAALVTWNLLETISNGKQQRDDKREVWIEIGKQQAQQDVTNVRLGSLESRVDKLEDRK